MKVRAEVYWSLNEDLSGQFACLSWLCFLLLVTFTVIQEPFTLLIIIILLGIINWQLIESLNYESGQLSYDSVKGQFLWSDLVIGKTPVRVTWLPINFVRLNSEQASLLIHTSALDTDDTAVRRMLTLSHWCRADPKSTEDSQERWA